MRRAQQRRGIIDALVCQWQRYTELSDKLRHWLQEAALDPEDEPQWRQHQGRVTALQQARGVLDHIQVKIQRCNIPQLSYHILMYACFSVLYLKLGLFACKLAPPTDEYLRTSHTYMHIHLNMLKVTVKALALSLPPS